MNVDPKYSIQLSRRKNQTGLTLIEILVTVVISSIGLMGLAALQLQAREATNDSGNRSQAIWLFNDIVNRIHANEGDSFSYVTNGRYVCGEEVPTACTTYNTGIKTVVPAECSGVQMADWDKFEVACGSPKEDGYFGNSVTYLPSAELNITCANGAPVCANGATLKVELKWRAQLDTERVTGRARTATSGELVLSDIITP